MNPAVETAGVEAVPPPGCEARIRTRRPEGPLEPGDVSAADAARSRPILHVSTSALVADRGDFGSGVVETMRSNDVFVSLVELDESQASTALCNRAGLPRAIAPARYRPDSMQRTIAGQAGTQVFFTEHDRAFCLYVVLGSHARRLELAPVVNRILAGITIGPN